VSGREEPKPYVHANVAVGEVLEPCVRGVVAIGGAFLSPVEAQLSGLSGPC
jgi:hypothetical protein